MKSIRLMCLICVLCVCLMTGCGYNPIMYAHLSDRNNYGTYTVQIVDMFYSDHSSGEKIRDYSDARFLWSEVVFWVTFPTYEDADHFYGYTVDREKPLCEYIETFEVPEENNKLLTEHQFYEHISLGETVEITASHWIYMDGYFYYIIGLRYGEEVYLAPEEGLKNVIDMMDKDRSLI